MTTSITLHLLLTPLVLGQDTVPDPQKSKDDKPKQGDTQKKSDPLDGFFPNAPNKNKKNTDEQSLEKALGTNIPTSVKTALDELRALHLGERLWFYLKDDGASRSDSIYLLPDNRILRLAPFPSNLRIYTYNTATKTWTEIGSRTNDPTNSHTNPEIKAGIKAILESRKERGWISPTIRAVLKSHRIEVTQQNDGTLTINLPNSNIDGDAIYVLKDGRLIILAPNKNDPKVFIYSMGKVTPAKDRKRGTHPDEEIQEAVRFILKSRKDRGWKAPSSKCLEAINTKDLSDGTWAYYGSDKEAHGDSVYVLPSGEILALSKKPSDLRIWILKPRKDGGYYWEQLGNRTKDPNNPHSDPEISKGIKAILDSREKRDWVSPRIKELKELIKQWQKIHDDELEASRVTSVPIRSREEREAIYNLLKTRTRPYLQKLKEELASWSK